MKNQTLAQTILILAMASMTMIGCSQSSVPKSDVPTLMQFLVNNGEVASPAQTLCLSNVFLLNSCVGGAEQAQGFSGAICGANIANDTEKQLGAFLVKPYATKCIVAKINASSCNLPGNKSVNYNEALSGPFAGLTDCTGD